MTKSHLCRDTDLGPVNERVLTVCQHYCKFSTKIIYQFEIMSIRARIEHQSVKSKDVSTSIHFSLSSSPPPLTTK